MKFFFRYVQKINKPPTPALHIGSVAHVVLKSWNMARWKKQPFQIELLKNLFEEHWKEQPEAIDWEGEEAVQKNTAWLTLETYFRQTPIKAEEMTKDKWA